MFFSKSCSGFLVSVLKSSDTSELIRCFTSHDDFYKVDAHVCVSHLEAGKVSVWVLLNFLFVHLELYKFKIIRLKRHLNCANGV